MSKSTTIYLVLVWTSSRGRVGTGKPERAFREESAAQHYIDHHDKPNLCAIIEVQLIE